MKTYNRTYTAKNTLSRQGLKPQFIVLHDTAGNGGLGDVKYLANPSDGRVVGVDFVVPKEGVVYQLNPDLRNRCTPHAGRNTHFRGFSNAKVNLACIGIEIGQKADMRQLNPKYPAIQVQAVADLCRDLCDEFGFTKTDITTHAKIITDGSRSDPREFPWDSFWQYFSGDRDEKIYHEVVPGDTLYAIAVRYLTSVEKIKSLNGMNTASNFIRPGQKLLVKE